ncbi:MAG: hypothetical protein K9M56_02565 [Victivallales bacterium]|nr:hypothetical protein [Victivallales bacterium]
MKTVKIGCIIIYSAALLIIGMIIYKYRTEIINFAAEKYSQTIDYTKSEIEDIINGNFND